MKRNPAEQLTPLELEVMKVLWKTGPVTVQSVHEGMRAVRPLAYNTVQTVLSILHRKGKVKRKTQERAYIYAAAVSQEKAAGQALQDLINRVFGGRPEELLLNMVKSRQLTAEQLAELGRMVEEAGDGHP